MILYIHINMCSILLDIITKIKGFGMYRNYKGSRYHAMQKIKCEDNAEELAYHIFYENEYCLLSYNNSIESFINSDQESIKNFTKLDKLNILSLNRKKE